MTKIPTLPNRKVFCPQYGPQTEFLSNPADIVIYGGAAGGGKSFALLLEALRATQNPQYAGVIFRRTSTQITAPGGLWEAAGRIYPMVGGRARSSNNHLDFVWKNGARVAFRHLQHETDKFNWQGSELAMIGIDELTHFTAGQFWYLVSRNRSTIGVRPYIRATTNPAPGWVRTLLAPWIDKSFPHPAKSGEIRRFVRDNDEVRWLDPDEPNHDDQLTLSFVQARLTDNPALMDADPKYLSNLKALPNVERKRLLEGDWNVFEGAFFDEFSEIRHTIRPKFQPKQGLPSHWKTFGGLDWGFKSPFAFGLFATDEEGNVHLIESVQRTKLTNEEQADVVLGVLSKWGVKPEDCPIAADPSMWDKHHARQEIGYVGEADIEAFLRAGLLCAKADNNRRPGWSQVRKFLHRNRLKIWKGFNVDITRFFPMAQYVKDREGRTVSEDQAAGEWEHLLDMLRYALMTRPRPSRDPNKPKPQDHTPAWMKRKKQEAKHTF